MNTYYKFYNKSIREGGKKKDVEEVEEKTLKGLEKDLWMDRYQWRQKIGIRRRTFYPVIYILNQVKET